MCLYLKKEDVLCVADKDFICYKKGFIDDKNFHPYYYEEFTYIPHKLTDEVNLIVDQTDQEKQKQLKYIGYGNIISEIDKGYHAYISYEEAIINSPFDAMFQLEVNNLGHPFGYGIFLVLKGTDFYINEQRNELVASQMVYLGECKSELRNFVRENINKLDYKKLKL